MTRFDLQASDAPSRFSLVIAPFRALQLVVEPADVEPSLSCVHRHLRPGGRLVFDVTDPRPATIAKEGEATELYGVRNPVTGRFVQVIVTGQTLDESGRVLTECWRFDEVDRDGRFVRTEEEELTLRWIPSGELRALFKDAGFAVEAEYTDFDGTLPVSGEEARDQAWIARKSPRNRLDGRRSAR